jgi:hypothetical protein
MLASQPERAALTCGSMSEAMACFGQIGQAGALLQLPQNMP